MLINTFMLETLPVLHHDALRGDLPAAAFLQERTGPLEQLAAAAKWSERQEQAAPELLEQLAHTDDVRVEIRFAGKSSLAGAPRLSLLDWTVASACSVRSANRFSA